MNMLVHVDKIYCIFKVKRKLLIDKNVFSATRQRIGSSLAYCVDIEAGDL